MNLLANYIFLLGLPTHLAFITAREYKQYCWDFWGVLLFLLLCAVGVVTLPFFLLSALLEYLERKSP